MNIIEPIARQALIQPNQPALILGERSLSYRDLMGNVVLIAGRLHEAGVVPKDVVAIIAPGLLAHIVLTLAIARLGAVSLPLTPNSREGHNEEIAELAGVGFLVHTYPGEFELKCPGIRRQISLKSIGGPGQGKPMPIVSAEPGDLWRIGLSSGTTGRPKAIKFDHQSMVLRSQLMRTLFPTGPGDRMMVYLGVGLQFAVGYWMRSLTNGGTVIGTDASPPAVMQVLRDERVDFLVTSPGNAIALLKVAQAPGSAFAEPSPHLKTLCLGGSSVSPKLQQGFRRHLCPNLAINYGATEAGLVALSDSQLQDADPTSAGRLVPWAEVQAVDENDQPLPAGQRGLLRMRSPVMSSGYIHAAGDVQAERAFLDGWFWSNDIGSVNAQGIVHLAGRQGDVLNLAGLKIDPARIESVINEDPAVIESVVLAAPAVTGGSVLVAAVVAPSGVDVAALKRRCADTLGPSMVPITISVLESLPRNEAGKVQRNEVLRSIAANRQLSDTAPAKAE